MFAIRADWLFLLGINFFRFSESTQYSVSNIDIMYMQWKYIFSNNTTVCVCKISNSLYPFCFWMKGTSRT